jgi:putative component of membrane protein insertase Oxa1/YidC/SpoIIIJ protein YidD
MNAAIPLPPAGTIVAGLIRIYQRFISPYKRFACAYRVKKRRCSCSEFGRRVATRFGLLKLPELLRRRFRKCSHAARVLDYESRQAKPARKDRPLFRSNDCRDGLMDAACNGGADCATEAGCQLVAAGCDAI